MFWKTILLSMALIGFVSSTRKLLYIQAIPKNLKQSQIYECIQMDPDTDKSLKPALDEAAREDKEKPGFFRRLGKMMGVAKGPKKKFSCMGKEVNISQPQWVCKKITKIARPSLKPVMCQNDVKTIYVIKTDDERKVYGLCLDTTQFYVFTFSPDLTKCPLESRGMSQAGEPLKKALLSAAYSPLGCSSSVLGYFEETWEKMTNSLERDGEVASRVNCFFGLLESVQKTKTNFIKQFEKIIMLKQEAERRGYQLQLSPTTPGDADPFIAQKDLDTLHDSVFWSVRKRITYNHFNQAKHQLKLEALNVNALEAAFNTHVERAKQEVIVEKSEPVTTLISNNNLSFSSIWQIARWFMISQPKYRRLLVTRVMLSRNIKDACGFRGTRFLQPDHPLGSPAKLESLCKASCGFISDVGNALVFKNKDTISQPVCLHYSSGFCNPEDNKCYCIALADKQGPQAVSKFPLHTCARGIEVSLRAMRLASEDRRKRMEERKKKSFQAIWNG